MQSFWGHLERESKEAALLAEVTEKAVFSFKRKSFQWTVKN